MINVADYGAGRGYNDTETLRDAANAAARARRAMQPAGGSWVGNTPELFFPAGVYSVTEPIVIDTYTSVRGEDALVIQQDPTMSIFDFRNCYHNRVTGMQFVGGKRQLVFSNGNTDFTQLVVRECGFQGWSDVAISAEGTIGDRHMSANLLVDSSTFDGGTALLSCCDVTSVVGCRHQYRGRYITDDQCSAFINGWARGTMYIDRLTATPACPEREGQAFWLHNFGSAILTRSRFGGEYAGIPIVTDFGGPNLTNPWMGRELTIMDSQVSCGQDVWLCSSLITLAGVPQSLNVLRNRGITSNSVPVVRVADGYDLAADVNKILADAPASYTMYSVDIRSNQFYSPAPLPSPLRQFVRS